MRATLGVEAAVPRAEAKGKTAPIDPRTSAPARKRDGEKLGVATRALAILDHVATARTPVDVFDIMTALQLPKATAYRLVDWFVGQGYLTREPGRKRLIAGPRLTRLALGVLASTMQNASPHIVLQRLAHTVNETCNIGTLVNGEVVYLDRVEADHWPLRLHFSSGSRVPLHCSAIGKLFLALAPSSRRRRLLRAIELRPFTEHTITRPDRLEAEMRQIRRDQVAFDREEFLAGVVCAAVPIIGRDGDMTAAVAIQAPQARMSLDDLRSHLPAMRRAATDLSEIFQADP